MGESSFLSVALGLQLVQSIWRPYLRPVKWLATSVLILGFAACRAPRNQMMLVAYIQGDGFSPRATAKDWKYGQGVECVLASDSHQFPPDKRGDVLLCGDQTQHVWSMVWLRSDVQDQIYDAGRMFDVTFHGTGRGSRTWGTSWWCKRLSQGIDCE